MRFIHDVSNETVHVLQRFHKQSCHHRVRQRAHCILLSFQGDPTNDLADIFHVVFASHSWEINHIVQCARGVEAMHLTPRCVALLLLPRTVLGSGTYPGAMISDNGHAHAHPYVAHLSG